MEIERKGGIIVDSGQLIGLIIGVVVVLAIVVVATMLSRKRKAEANRNKAVEMRERAKTEEIGAREREAQAARAEADAKQAEVEAERLREEAQGRQKEAEQVRAGAQEQLRKADELDPDVVAGGRDAHEDQVPGEVAGSEELRRDRSDRNPSSSGQTAAPDAGRVNDGPIHDGQGTGEPGRTDESRGDHPRNL